MTCAQAAEGTRQENVQCMRLLVEAGALVNLVEYRSKRSALQVIMYILEEEN